VPRPADGVDVSPSCRNETDQVNGTSVRRDWPGDATTGPEVTGHDEDFLSPSGVDGRWVITEDGTVIDAVYHYGIVDVRADDVTIRNSVICGAGPQIVLNEGHDLVIEDSIVRGETGRAADSAQATGAPCEAAVVYGDYTIRRSEITDCVDGLKVAGDVEVTDSWFHDNYDNRLGGGAGTHNDTVQQADSALGRLVFEGNAVYQDPCTSNRHFQMAPTGGPRTIGTLRIEGNFFYGINGFMFDRGIRVDDGVIRANTFAGSASQGPFHGLLYAGTGMGDVTARGNVYESGEPADANAGPTYRCVPG
jgi:hypothetical protein